MITETNDKLIKVRNQIRIAEKYIADNPEWRTPVEVLKALRKREHELTNQAQVEILKTAVREIVGVWV